MDYFVHNLLLVSRSLKRTNSCLASNAWDVYPLLCKLLRLDLGLSTVSFFFSNVDVRFVDNVCRLLIPRENQTLTFVLAGSSAQPVSLHSLKAAWCRNSCPTRWPIRTRPYRSQIRTLRSRIDRIFHTPIHAT